MTIFRKIYGHRQGMADDGWNYPINAWQDPVMVPAAAQSYVSVVPSWDSNGRLITESYAYYP